MGSTCAAQFTNNCDLVATTRHSSLYPIWRRISSPSCNYQAMTINFQDLFLHAYHLYIWKAFKKFCWLLCHRQRTPGKKTGVWNPSKQAMLSILFVANKSRLFCQSLLLQLSVAQLRLWRIERSPEVDGLQVEFLSSGLKKRSLLVEMKSRARRS